MTENPTSAENEAVPQTTAELLARIDGAWSQLLQTIGELNEVQLATLRDAQGWSVKDHLVHLTAWEQSLLALLEGRDRDEAIGLGDVDHAGMEVDDVNAAIHRRNQHLSLEDAVAAFHQSHAQVRASVAALSDADLFKPYSHYQPNDPPANNNPVIGWIIGNTYEHYLDHDGWIRGLVEARS